MGVVCVCVVGVKILTVLLFCIFAWLLYLANDC